MEYLSRMKSPVGLITAASDGTGITGLWIENQKYYASKLGETQDKEDLPVFKEVKRWLDCYFAGKEPDFMPPLTPKGSSFQQSVWNILREIPYGSVITYGEIGKRLEQQNGGTKRVAAQAVGGAVGHNPISIMIPCHRVIGAKGNLTGYAGGLSVKTALLKLEKVPMDHMFTPKRGTAL